MKTERGIAQLWQKIHPKTQEPGLFTTLIRGAGAALFIQTLSMALNYGMQVLLARWLGVTDYGIFEYATTIATVLAFLAGFGLSDAVLRFAPEYLVKRDWSHLQGLLWGSWRQTLNLSVAIATIATLAIFWLNSIQPISFAPALMLGMWSIPLIALTKVQLEIARSMQQIFLAYAPSLLIYPILFLSVLYAWIQTNNPVNSFTVITLSILTLFIILIVQRLRLGQRLPAPIDRAIPAYSLRQWLLVSLPLLFINGSFLVLNQTDTVMIGLFLQPQSVGIYNAAYKTSAGVSFILVAVNAIAAPLFAKLYAQNDRQGLQKLVSAIAQWMFYPAFIAAFLLAFFADPILQLFGSEFVAAKWSLLALIIGQLVNVGAGSVGYLLTMTGHHNQCARVVGCCALLNIGLNLVGIPLFGILGAAIATALSMSLWNIWLNRLVVKSLGVNPSIVAAWRNQLRHRDRH